MKKGMLVDMLGKKEISVYAAGQIIEAVGKLFQEMERSLICDLKEDARRGAETLVGFAKEIAGKYAAINDEILTEASQGADLADEIYVRVRDQKNKVIEKLEGLPKLPAIAVPHSIEELLDLAERCKHMNDEQWARVIDLAKALQKTQVAG